MKRIGHLFDTVVSFDNLIVAAKKAMRGKTDNPSTARFHLNMEKEALELRAALLNGTYRPGPYDCFEIHDPKHRYICSVDIRDRVVHHAICNVLEPILERRFIFDSYACRVGKGTHRAVQRAQSFCRKRRYFLKTDVEKFFESIDHAVLKDLLRRKIKDPDLLRLMERIIDQPVPGYAPGKGLAIGNLTSQWWANFYLDPLDHFLKDDRGVKCYARYMDDAVLFADDKETLHLITADLRRFLSDRLKLRLKENATFIAPVTEGVPFLGFRIFPGLIRLKRKNVIRFRRKFRAAERQILAGGIDEAPFISAANSLVGHIRHADTHRMRQKFFYPDGA